MNGLPQFATQRYDRAMDAVCQRLSVGTGEGPFRCLTLNLTAVGLTPTLGFCFSPPMKYQLAPAQYQDRSTRLRPRSHCSPIKAER